MFKTSFFHKIFLIPKQECNYPLFHFKTSQISWVEEVPQSSKFTKVTDEIKNLRV